MVLFVIKLVSIIFSICTFSHVIFTTILSYKRRQLGFIIFVD